MSGDFIYVVKENVQPIRSGRKPQLVQQVLSTPLTQHKSELDRRIEYVSLLPRIPQFSSQLTVISMPLSRSLLTSPF